MSKVRESWIEFLRIRNGKKNKKRTDASFRTYTYRNDYKSQFYQDYIVANFIFPGKKDGVFLDVGANHPIEINNTYYFEQMGWTGLAIEPQKHFLKLWEKYRSANFLPVAIGDCEKAIVFNELRSDVLSGINVDGQDIYQTYEVQQRRLDNILRENNIHTIDYMSLDVEGFEIQVLNSIDWNTTTIKCMSVESNEDNAELKTFLIERGYTLLFEIGVDGIWVHEQYVPRPFRPSL